MIKITNNGLMAVIFPKHLTFFFPMNLMSTGDWRKKNQAVAPSVNPAVSTALRRATSDIARDPVDRTLLVAAPCPPTVNKCSVGVMT